MDLLLRSAPNASSCQSHQEESQLNEINEALFWTTTVVSALIVIPGAVANIVVLYYAKQEPSTGALRHLNRVVKHLAVSDLLYGVLATPFSLAYWRLGKIYTYSE